ncbi:MAG TPA: response regulator [Candidatus Omnitrophota bacterium]|nr:response regulator [Candidatus Omnitrophota bacterium]HPD85633.1 response regulator [Candidatus Omnitrophota bacterium]HRZ04476.1 response regulator [Candidatus Omnitrophota bacterium]
MKKPKVLICDDEEGIRESLKLILSDHYDLILTESGEQCLECIANAKDIGLVLIDIKMPKVSGLEILQKIKEKRPDLKVIVVTGYKSVETATEAVKLGAAGYIVKPFKSNEILAAVQNNIK